MMLVRCLLPAVLILTLSACGKAGAPVAPGSPFPFPYPNPNLSPTASARGIPEDQAGLNGDTEKKPKFTPQGSYIDPSVRATELSRSSIAPGSTLPNTQLHSSDGSTDTPFNQTIGRQGVSPLAPVVPADDSSPDPQ